MTRFLLALLCLAAGNLPTATHAQTCGANRPAISVVAAADGHVTVSGGQGALVSLAFEAAADSALTGPGLGTLVQPPATVTLPAGTTSYTFQLYTRVSGAAVHLPFTVTDGCGPWPTFAGSGTASPLPYAPPTPTNTPTPIPPTSTPVPPTNTPAPTATATPTMLPTAAVPSPSPTPPVIATTTPVTTPHLYYTPQSVLQGNEVIVQWEGRGSPTTTDFLVITDQSGLALGPRIYTNSCTTTAGTSLAQAGGCTFTLGTSFPPGTNYQIRWYAANSATNLLILVQPLEVKALGAAVQGRAQAWGWTWIHDIPTIALNGGFIGVSSRLNPGDQTAPYGEAFHHTGLAELLFFGYNFIEAGFHKQCDEYGCWVYPYISWRDQNGVYQQIDWRGAGFPLVLLQPNRDTSYGFNVYELAERRTNGEVGGNWTADFCDTRGICCPLWVTGYYPCAPPLEDDQPPALIRTRFPVIFGGAESIDPREPAGETFVSAPYYCCDFAHNNWTPLGCYRWKRNTYDPQWTWTIITGCDAGGNYSTTTGVR